MDCGVVHQIVITAELSGVLLYLECRLGYCLLKLYQILHFAGGFEYFLESVKLIPKYAQAGLGIKVVEGYVVGVAVAVGYLSGALGKVYEFLGLSGRDAERQVGGAAIVGVCHGLCAAYAGGLYITAKLYRLVLKLLEVGIELVGPHFKGIGGDYLVIAVVWVGLACVKATGGAFRLCRGHRGFVGRLLGGSRIISVVIAFLRLCLHRGLRGSAAGKQHEYKHCTYCDF